jgi:hypothetical protein
MRVANSWFGFTSVICILVYEKELYQDVQGIFGTSPGVPVD